MGTLDEISHCPVRGPLYTQGQEQVLASLLGASWLEMSAIQFSVTTARFCKFFAPSILLLKFGRVVINLRLSAFPEQWDLPSLARAMCELPLPRWGYAMEMPVGVWGSITAPCPPACPGSAAHIQISTSTGSLTCGERCTAVLLGSNG